MKNIFEIEERIIFEKLTSDWNISEEEREISADSSDAEINMYLKEICLNIEMLQQTKDNYAHREIISRKGPFGKIIIFIKKVIRRCLKWYINPICEQQTEFNTAITPIEGRMTEILTFLVENEKKHQENLNLIEHRINVLEKTVEEYKQSIIELKHEAHIQELKVEECIKNADKREWTMEFYGKELLDVQYEIKKIKEKEGIVGNYLNCIDEKMLVLEEMNIFDNNKENFWNKRTVSQSGEDSIVAYITMVLGYKYSECTYLDLGANHARDLSNTYLFYSMGAKGVLVEANPKLIPELEFYRNKDLILNKCVALTDGEKSKFYILSGDGLSTNNFDMVQQYLDKNPNLLVEDIVEVETISVNSIIEKYLGKAPVILNIDVEGIDLEILNSIDFEKYRPTIIICEMIEYSQTLEFNKKDESILKFMETKNYFEYAFTGINSIFIAKEKIKVY